MCIRDRYGPGQYLDRNFLSALDKKHNSFSMDSMELHNKMKFFFLSLFFISKILFTADSLNASHPKPQIDSVGCIRILPDFSHSIEEFLSSDFLSN